MSSKGRKSKFSLTKPGEIVIISSPSGGGKTSICKRLLSPARRKNGWSFSVSYTTRKRRPGEREGHAYNFVSDNEFDKLSKKSFFAEYCRVHLYKYGTPRLPLKQVRRAGGVIILDVDVQGALKLRREYPDAIGVFVLPPSITDLKKRLRKRGTETSEQLAVRFKTARKEMKSFRKFGFEYVVVNEELDTAVKEVLAIITAHSCRLDQISKEQIKRITG